MTTTTPTPLLTRYSNWPARLGRFLDEVCQQEFKWGEHDCALFACGCIEAMTGIDLARDFRGEYNTRAGAARAMRQFAGKGLEAVVEKRTAAYGMREVDVRFAQRGDVVLLETKLGPALGIVHLNGVAAVFAAPEGLTFVHTHACRRAWRV